MDSIPDYYAILRVGPAATQQEISRAYRALMRTHHPDVGTSNAEERKVQDAELLGIMQAFAVLRDPVRRAAYDRSTKRQGSKGRAGTGQGSTRQSFTAQKTAGSGAQNIPVRKVRSRTAQPGNTIRITPVRWESGPWA